MAAAQKVDWDAVKLAVVSGEDLKEVAASYGATYDSLRMRMSREKWPTNAVIRKRMSQAVRKAPDEQISNRIAESWAEKGEKGRVLAHNIALKALQTLEKKPLRVKDWREADLADKMLRRAAGLKDNDGAGTVVNFGVLTNGPVQAEVIEG